MVDSPSRGITAVAAAVAVGTIAFYAADTQTRKCEASPDVLAAFQPAETSVNTDEISFIGAAGNTERLGFRSFATEHNSGGAGGAPSGVCGPS